MSELSGFPYHDVQFTRDGQLFDQNEATAVIEMLDEEDATDLLVISHGWNNDLNDARNLYAAFFASVRAVLDGGSAPNLAGRRFGVLGVLWPSKKFADRELIASGAAGVGELVPDEEVAAAVDTLAEALRDPRARAALTRAKRLIPRLDDEPGARRRFADALRKPLPRDAANDEDASQEFFGLRGDHLMDRLSNPVAPAGMHPSPRVGGGAASLIGGMAVGGAAGGIGEVAVVGAAAVGPAGGLASPPAFFGGLVSGARAAALRLANYSTYYLMKQRAGAVGRDGVCPLLRRASEHRPALKLHLIGHSFGGRLVAAVAAASVEPPPLGISSMTLLQAAFSQHGFAQHFDGVRDGFFRRAIDDHAVSGPILITYTANDTAVGNLYPVASLLAGDDASALGEATDPYGGIGRNGAQKTPEAVAGTLLAVAGDAYAFAGGALYNLEASAFIKDHGDVAGREVARAVLTAVSTT